MCCGQITYQKPNRATRQSAPPAQQSEAPPVNNNVSELLSAKISDTNRLIKEKMIRNNYHQQHFGGQ